MVNNSKISNLTSVCTQLQSLLYSGQVTDPDLTLPAASEEGASKSYKLASLYDKYFEHAAMLAAQGLVKEATEYLKLIPQAYTGSAFDSGVIRQRLLIASGELAIRTAMIKDHASRKAPVSASYTPAAATIARARTPSQGGQYLPPRPSYQPAQLSHHPEPLKDAPVISKPASPCTMLTQACTGSQILQKGTYHYRVW